MQGKYMKFKETMIFVSWPDLYVKSKVVTRFKKELPDRQLNSAKEMKIIIM